MRKFILLAAIAATALPATAMAQSRGELRHDRREVRQEQRDLARAHARGDRHDVREQRRDVREARQELREDRRDHARHNYGRDDWRRYRTQNRALFARGDFHSPYRYRTFRPGARLAAGYYAPRYFIADPYRYHLPVARGPNRWVRYYDDALLVNVRSGVIVDMIRNFYW